MTEHSPTSAAGPAAKPLVKSKTFWLQIIVFASSFLPVVQEWLTTNPVPVISALAALGVLVRFVTHGRVRIFPDSGSGPPGAGVPLFVVVSGITAAGLCVALPSCVTKYQVDGTGRDWVAEPVQVLPASRVTPIADVPLPDDLGGGTVEVPIVISRQK